MSKPEPGSSEPERFEPADFEEIERRLNINRLQAEARELAGGEMAFEQSEDAPPEVLEEFWKHVVAFERAPLTSLGRRLEEAGIDVPLADELSAESLGRKLRQIFEFLATQEVFFSSTDHLSDRELYDLLRDEILPQRVTLMPPGSGGHLHWDILGSGSEEDMILTMRFYADDSWRETWARDFPDFPMPDKQRPPFDRDRSLPQAPLPHWGGDEGNEDEEDDLP